MILLASANSREISDLNNITPFFDYKLTSQLSQKIKIILISIILQIEKIRQKIQNSRDLRGSTGRGMVK